ncbi:MAG: TrkA family potassium uptake protein [Armatimonadetes bacterium]|nr:TrkA family potassium uptake protein [Armatimonadota bacterium]
MGKQIVKDFQAAAVPYVVIEWNPEQIPKLVEQDVPHIVGSAAEDATLAKAGVLKAKGLIAVTATDEENVFIVLTARVLNPKLYIVARSIQHENEDKLRRAGADRVMSPYVLGGHRIAAAILKPRAMDFLDVLQSSEVDVEIEDIRLSKKSPFVGKTIGESYVNKSTGATVLAVRRPGGEIVANPPRDFVMSPGDELVVMGASAQLDSAERLARGEA